MGNCLWCYFRPLFISLAFRKCKMVFNILEIILVLGTRSPIGFLLKLIILRSASRPLVRDLLNVILLWKNMNLHAQFT